MPLFAVLAVGADRPGIVAAVTGALAEAGANLDDTSMSILHGHFAIAMVVGGPAGVDVAAALAPVAEQLDLTVDVRPIPDGTPPTPPGARWSLSVYGADRPGMVASVTATVADAGGNVVDLTTRLVGGPDRPVYAMQLELALPDGLDTRALAERLQAVATGLGVDCTLTPVDADVL
ncbi:MAG: ACT domain-containing protein [Acidimicrobiales bacterium]